MNRGHPLKVIIESLILTNEQMESQIELKIKRSLALFPIVSLFGFK